MKRLVLMFVAMLCVSVSPAQEWSGGLTAGAAFPAGASDNAPGLSTSFAAGLRASYIRGGVAFTVMIDGVHWLKSEYPDRSAVPIDEGLYVSRALHFPATAGLAFFLGGRGGWPVVDVYAAAGCYWRNLTCKRMASPGVVDDMEEHGWGFACKVGFDVIFRICHSPRLSLGVSYLALGNPFATGGAAPAAGTGPIDENGVRRSQPTLEGYGQGFFNVSIGYWL